MATARKYDLYSDRFRAETYATFARMREEDAVFCQVGIDGETMLWFVTRHDDAVAVLLDDERFVRDPALALTQEELEAFRSGMPEGMAFVENHMLNKDGEDHRRLRRLVTKAFTPRMVEQLRPRIHEIADELIDAGHETTVSLIGNAVLALLQHPDQRKALESDPTLMSHAIEELLRYDGAVERTLNRWAATDVELGGESIRRGEGVIVILGSA